MLSILFLHVILNELTFLGGPCREFHTVDKAYILILSILFGPSLSGHWWFHFCRLTYDCKSLCLLILESFFLRPAYLWQSVGLVLLSLNSCLLRIFALATIKHRLCNVLNPGYICTCLTKETIDLPNWIVAWNCPLHFDFSHLTSVRTRLSYFFAILLHSSLNCRLKTILLNEIWRFVKQNIIHFKREILKFTNGILI
jgi:hypothetical protein